jgi:glycosyltransferase involved in cell wall biosynthesis
MVPSPAQPDKIAVAIVYWGRLGAGAALMAQLCAAMSRDRRFETYASYARQSELVPHLPPDHVIPVSTFSGPASLALRSTIAAFIVHRIVRRLVDAEVKVIITVMPHVWGIALTGAARRAGIRTILLAHDADPHPGEARPFFDRLVAAEIRMSDRVATLSNYVADRLVARGMTAPSQLIRLFHPVFQFGAGHFGQFPRQPFRMVFFGRILPYKGVPMLLEAFAALRAKGVRCALRVVGRGHDPGPPALEQQDGLSIEEGWVEPDAIAGILESADALVLPYREASQSGVVAAAYGAGLPVVVTPVGGLTEQVVDGETGVIAEAATAAALAAAMARLIETPGLYGHCRAGVRAYAATHSFDRFAHDLGDAVVRMLSDGQAEHPVPS